MESTQIATDDPPDRFGRIEQTGVEFIPEPMRDSSPLRAAVVFVGANFGLPTIVFGWLPIALGLDFWGALSSFVFGTLVAAVAIAPLAVLGPKTGTTVPVASGAHFGIRGRLIGSALALTASLCYTAIAVWTCGDAMVGALGRLFGVEASDTLLGISYAVVAVVFSVVAIYGYGTVAVVQRAIIPIMGAVMLLGVFVFAGDFDPARRTADYALGGYWQTWALCFTLGISGPVSYAPYIGDYTRKISERAHGRVETMVLVTGGIVVGLMIPTVFGMFTAVTFLNPTESYVLDIIGASPTWYVALILVMALMGGLGQGALCVYGTGLDLESFIPRLPRWQTTAITAALAIGLVYLGVFAVDASEALSTITLMLLAATVPWVAVLMIAAIRHFARSYDTDALQAFAQGRRGGRYWFTGGLNRPAVLAWAAGSAFGLLALETELYVGPLAGLMAGIDISAVGSFAIAALIYGGALVVMPGRVEDTAG